MQQSKIAMQNDAGPYFVKNGSTNGIERTTHFVTGNPTPPRPTLCFSPLIGCQASGACAELKLTIRNYFIICNLRMVQDNFK